MKTTTGKVYLVGAGPGDPGLMTVKGLECVKQADVLIYDFLASPTLLKHARETAEIIYVGKKGGDHTLPQDRINALIVEKAKSGLTVIRLKGGAGWAVGVAITEVVRAILKDEKRVLCVSSVPGGAYGIGDDVSLSLPTIIGKDGVEKVLEVELDAADKEALKTSAEHVGGLVEEAKKRL